MSTLDFTIVANLKFPSNTYQKIFYLQNKKL